MSTQPGDTAKARLLPGPTEAPEGLDMHVRGQSRGYREPGAGRQGAHTVSGTVSKSILLKKIYDIIYCKEDV